MTYIVDQSGSGDFTTIGEAMAVAVRGDTVVIKAGVYKEDVTVKVGVDVHVVGAELRSGTIQEEEEERHA